MVNWKGATAYQNEFGIPFERTEENLEHPQPG